MADPAADETDSPLQPAVQVWPEIVVEPALPPPVRMTQPSQYWRGFRFTATYDPNTGHHMGYEARCTARGHGLCRLTRSFKRYGGMDNVEKILKMKRVIIHIIVLQAVPLIVVMRIN